MKSMMRSLVEYILIIALTIACTLLAINLTKLISDINRKNNALIKYNKKNVHNTENVELINDVKQTEQ